MQLRTNQWQLEKRLSLMSVRTSKQRENVLDGTVIPPLAKELFSKVAFSRNAMGKVCNEEITVYRQPDQGGIEASQSWHTNS